MSTSSAPGRLYAARARDEETARLIELLRARGYVVYRKPHRRRGNRLIYTDQHGLPVTLEQLEIQP